MIYRKRSDGEIMVFDTIDAIGGNILESTTEPTQKEVEKYFLKQKIAEKENEIMQKYKEAKKSINLTIQIDKNKYLPPIQYVVDDLITLAESKISIINNCEQGNITPNSIEFTKNNEFIFRINGHILNLSKSALAKLLLKMSEIRSNLYNQQYDLLLKTKKAGTQEEVDNIIAEYLKQEEYDLTTLLT